MNRGRNLEFAAHAVNGGKLRMPVLFLHGEYDYTCETVTSRLAELWSVSANYTHLEREITDPLQPGIEVTGAPDDSAFVAFIYEPSDRWSITPSLELASDRWSEVTGGGFVRTGDYTMLNLQAQYRGGDLWEVAFGGTNLTDENFELANGYPQAGANLYLRLRLNF
jgi:iron complex outermembrane receptor protein